ncbi:MAG: M23/M56 family metallopeptidase [Hellea sp.]
MGQDLTHFLDSLGWAVIHSLWQGVVALITVVMLRVALGGRLPALRHAGQFIALIACLGAFLWTLAIYLGQPVNIVEGGATPITTGQTDIPSLLTGLMTPFDPSTMAAQTGFNISRITPILACFWALGFAVLSLRYAFAFGQVQQLRTLGVSMPSPHWQKQFARLLRQSDLPKNVKLLISSNVNGPMTLGFFKPIVLVPMSFLSGLPADEVEAVLMHELAHIRRHDYALNLIQTAIKTVLFFHPAIHIISRWADQDREQACDDLAVSQGRDPLALIRGLATLRLQSGPALTMAANGTGEDTPLMTRLTRLAGHTPSKSPLKARPEYIVMSVLSMLLIGSVYLGSSSSANAHPVPEEYEHAKADKHNYTFETKRLNGRNVTVKVTEDGRRWVLANGSWVDIDKSPEVIGRLPRAMPQPPEPPTPSTYKNGKFDSDSFDKKMNQFEVDLEYFEADMERYFDENKHLSEREQERIEEEVERQVERAERKAERIEERIEAEQDRIEAKIERAEVERERIEERAERQRERAQEQEERAEEQRERAEERRERAEEQRERAKERAKRDEKHTKYNELRETLYGYLINDGLISSRTEKASLRYVHNHWTVNGKAIPSAKEGKYCGVLSGLGAEKSTLTKVEITPGSTHIVNESKSGKQSQHITFGEFNHTDKTTHVHNETKVHKGRHVHKNGKVHDPVPPVPPVSPQSYIHKTSAEVNMPPPSFAWPTKSRHITAKYGQTGKLWETYHHGLDFKGNTGAPVFASADGTVQLVTTEKNWGNRIILEHASGYQSLYGHMDSLAVSRGQYVKAGDIIGGVGSTGKSTGPHLHFEIRKNGQTIDPAPLLK